MVLVGHNENRIFSGEFNFDRYLCLFESGKINWEYNEFFGDNQILEQKQLRNVLQRIPINSYSRNTWIGDFLKTFVDWGEEVEESFSIWVRRYVMSKNLTNWQIELWERLREEKGIVKFYIFKNVEGINSFWVITKEPSTDFILSCTEKYVEVLEKYADSMKCDFMVFGEDEINEELLPNNKIVLNC